MSENKYCVSCGPDQEEWYIVRRASKDGTRNRKVLSERYATAEDATEAMIQLIEAQR